MKLEPAGKRNQKVEFGYQRLLALATPNRSELDELIGPSPLDCKMKATYFGSVKSTSKQDIITTLRQLAQNMGEVRAKSKESLPLIKLARFGDAKTDRGSFRHDGNVISIHGIEGDYDAGAISMADAAERLRAESIAALLYTSPSHTAAAPRWRVLCPCSASLPPKMRAALVARLNGPLGGVLASESHTLSQSFYIGSVEGRTAPESMLVDGRYIDLADELDSTAIDRRKAGSGSGEAARDESGSGAAFRKAISLQLAGAEIAQFEEWAAGNPWRDYEANSERAVERTWKNAALEAGKIALVERRNAAHDFNNEGPEPGFMVATPFVIRGRAAMPKRIFYYGNAYGPKLLSAIAATGGVGKSMLTIVEALAMATGKSILGEAIPDGPKRVWHINSEDDREELDRRFEAAIEHHQITQADLGGRLFYTGNETRFIVAKEERGGLNIVRPVVEAIKAEIWTKGIDVLTIDPFVSTHTVSENANDKINAVAGLWREIAQECNCAVLLVHHMRKPAIAKPGQSHTSYTVDDARGAVALKDATRFFRVINKMTDATAAKLGIANAWRHLHVTDGKANYAPPVTAGKWFRLASVAATADDPGVGVIEAWEFPDTAAGVTAPEICRALDILKDGTARVDTRSPDWAGVKIAAALRWDTDDKGKLKAVLAQWVKLGYLATETRPDTKRMSREYYRVTAAPKADFIDEADHSEMDFDE